MELLVPVVVVDDIFWLELLTLYFRFMGLFMSILLLFIVGISGVRAVEGGDIISPMPESSNVDLSAKTGDERGIRFDCNGTDRGVAKDFGVEVDTNVEKSGMNP